MIGVAFLWLHRCTFTPLKIKGGNLKKHAIEEENHLKKTSILGFHVNFPGCK